MTDKAQNDLIDRVIEQIKEDVFENDCTAIEGLLGFVDPEKLKAYLSEEAAQ
jgi:hypothetical protein